MLSEMPRKPWNVLWIQGRCYLIDADGRKIATLLGTQGQREAVADALLDAFSDDAKPEVQAYMVERQKARLEGVDRAIKRARQELEDGAFSPGRQRLTDKGEFKL